jgi:hypothetical protein
MIDISIKANEKLDRRFARVYTMYVVSVSGRRFDGRDEWAAARWRRSAAKIQRQRRAGRGEGYGDESRSRGPQGGVI